MKKTPLHVAFIMDGNGRWAEMRGKPRIEGHRAGLNTVKRIIESCLKQSIQFVSVFAFSSENWNRPEAEVAFLMELFIEALEAEVETLNEHEVSFRFSGHRAILSPNLRQKMQQAETLTKNNNKLILNVAVNYSGKWDIVQASQAIANKVKLGQLNPESIDETCFAAHLVNPDLPEPDLLIRTSGEERISNFALWQLAYTELYFTNTLWPDFDENEFAKALQNYAARERRFGQV